MKNFYTRYFLSAILFASIIFADENQNSVTGSVINKSEGLPLKGANVELKGDNNIKYGAITDDDGRFNIDKIEDGTYKIIISFIGFEDYRDDVAIESGKSYKVDAVLEIQPIVMSRLEIISDASAPYQKLPGAATVMDMQTIKLVNPIGTQEMLEHIPGITGYADDGIGNSRISISVRGLNPRRSSRVLILEDGVPIQPALYVYPNMYYNPPAERIDRLEVIKGSGAISFGPQTMGGVINYFTRRPRNEFGGTFKVTAGENGFASLFAEVGGSKNQKLKPEIQLLYKKGDGFRQNNGFEQLNSTIKLNFLPSLNKNVYLKSNINYENSNATYTGLTNWSFENDPKFNPKENDNFKIFRASLDLIQSERLSSVLSKNTIAYTSYFDRRWWRENDIFILASDLDQDNPSSAPYYSPFDLVRTGNGQDSFGILRTFYVAGYEQSYLLKHNLYGYKSTLEIGGRMYWERFIDDKKQGDSPDSRDGIYFIPAASEDEAPTIVGQSHHYETMAFSGFITESIDLKNFSIRPGVRFELFEQERVDRLAGSTYLDKSTSVVLPGIGFIGDVGGLSLFGGIHRGFTPPSSGALKILNFGENVESGGLDLKAEKSWNKEIGIRGEISFIDFEFSGYHVSIEDLVAAGRGTAFKNLGKVNTMGIETRTSLGLSNLNKYLPNIDVTYSFLHSEVVEGEIISNVSGSVGSQVSIEGKELPYAPAHTLMAGIYKDFGKIASIRLDVKYVSEVYTDFENIKRTDNIGIQGPVPEYAILNLSAYYKLNEKTNLYLSGKNITDESYIGSRLHSNPGQKEAGLSSGIIIGPRRQINIGLEYNF